MGIRYDCAQCSKSVVRHGPDYADPHADRHDMEEETVATCLAIGAILAAAFVFLVAGLVT